MLCGTVNLANCFLQFVMFDKKYLISSFAIFANTLCLILITQLNSNIIRANISTESPLNDVSFYFSDGIEGLYFVVAIDLDDTSNTDNRGFIAIMDIRNRISYRHILQSNTITMPGHSNAIVSLKGVTNYLCSSIRLVRY